MKTPEVSEAAGIDGGKNGILDMTVGGKRTLGIHHPLPPTGALRGPLSPEPLWPHTVPSPRPPPHHQQARLPLSTGTQEQEERQGRARVRFLGLGILKKKINPIPVALNLEENYIRRPGD